MTVAFKYFEVPTGEIYACDLKEGALEFVSVGDYGKERNIKADFLGITRHLNGVDDGEVLPLSEKWVITISTQHGCSMDCKFCDVPLVARGRNVSKENLDFQVITAIKNHPEVTHTKRLNIHYARMGEPTFNPDVLEHATTLKHSVANLLSADTVHPVVSTMMPRKNKNLEGFLQEWVQIKNEVYSGEAGLQLSINSTDNEQRAHMFSNNTMCLEDIAVLVQDLPRPVGRKYALNFALADNSIVDAAKLAKLFDPDNFMVKITPIHNTKTAGTNNIATACGYDSFTPYEDVETRLKSEGFDVIVFVPSKEEELGMITCGNAVLSGRQPANATYKTIRLLPHRD